MEVEPQDPVLGLAQVAPGALPAVAVPAAVVPLVPLAVRAYLLAARVERLTAQEAGEQGAEVY